MPADYRNADPHRITNGSPNANDGRGPVHVGETRMLAVGKIGLHTRESGERKPWMQKTGGPGAYWYDDIMTA